MRAVLLVSVMDMASIHSTALNAAFPLQCMHHLPTWNAIYIFVYCVCMFIVCLPSKQEFWSPFLHWCSPNAWNSGWYIINTQLIFVEWMHEAWVCTIRSPSPPPPPKNNSNDNFAVEKKFVKATVKNKIIENKPSWWYQIDLCKLIGAFMLFQTH